MDLKRGAGYWLWKPYIILDKLKKIDKNEFIFYVNSYIKFLLNPDIFLDLCSENNGILNFVNDLPGSKIIQRIKRDALVLMGMDSEKYYSEPESLSGIQLYQKNDYSVKFLTELLRWSTYNDSILTDAPNICGKPNHDEFIEHRHDQSILTLLRVKYQIEGYRDPTQYGDIFKKKEIRNPKDYLPLSIYDDNQKLNSNFNTIFFHGREINRIRYWLKYKIPSILRYLLAKITNEF